MWQRILKEHLALLREGRTVMTMLTMIMNMNCRSVSRTCSYNSDSGDNPPPASPALFEGSERERVFESGVQVWGSLQQRLQSMQHCTCHVCLQWFLGTSSSSLLHQSQSFPLSIFRGWFPQFFIVRVGLLTKLNNGFSEGIVNICRLGNSLLQLRLDSASQL